MLFGTSHGVGEQLEAVGEAVPEAVSQAGEAVVSDLSLFGDFFSAAHLSQVSLLGLRMLIVIAIILLIRKVAVTLIDRMLRNRLSRSLAARMTAVEEGKIRTINHLLRSVVSYGLYFIGFLMCLDIAEINVTTLLAGAGFASLAVAFVSQSLVKDWMSGLFILIENQYGVGEYVQLGQYTGRVAEVGMKTTTLVTYQGEKVFIPNGSIIEIVNYSRLAQRGTVDVGIAYDEDLERAMAIIEAACQRVNARFAEDLDEVCQVAGVESLTDYNVQVRTTFTAYNWNQVTIARALRREIKEAFGAANIEIPYPQMALRHYDDKASEDALRLRALAEIPKEE